MKGKDLTTFNLLKNFKDQIYEDNLDCSSSKLTSLKGAPEIIKKTFNCSYNNLTSLLYSPSIVDGGFLCKNNKLISLEFGPSIVGQSYTCTHNKLKNLIGCPKIIHSFFKAEFNELETLEGCPEIVESQFTCFNNKIRTLKYAPKEVKSFDCSDNLITSLEGFNTKITSNIFIAKNNLNPYLELEYKTRINNKHLSEMEIKLLMFELTKSDWYLSKQVQDIFLF